jgi:hypothetical protein
MQNVNKILLTSCLSVILSLSSVAAQAGTTRNGANSRGGVSNHSSSTHNAGTHSNSRSNFHSSTPNTVTRSKTSSSGNVTISQSAAYDSGHRNHSTTVTNNKTQNSVVHAGNSIHSADNTAAEHHRSTTVNANGSKYNTDKYTAKSHSSDSHFVAHGTKGEYVNPTGVEATHQKETHASQSRGTEQPVKQIKHSSYTQSYNHEHNTGRYRAKSTTITSGESGAHPTIERTLVVQ